MLVNRAINVGQGILDSNGLQCRHAVPRSMLSVKRSRKHSLRDTSEPASQLRVAMGRFLKRGQNLDRSLIGQSFRVVSPQQDSFHFVVAK